MKNLNRILFFVLLIEASLLYIQSSSAYFSDSAVSSANTFTASTEFAVASPTPTPQIVINEVASGGNNDSEWIELYNRSDSEVDVSNWKIADDEGSDDLPSVSPIPAGGFGVIKTSDSSLVVPVSAISIVLTATTIGGSGLNANGEPIYLRNASNFEVDSMSYGDNSSIFPTPPGAPTSSQSLIRDPNGIDTDTASDWKLDSSPSIGIANSL